MHPAFYWWWKNARRGHGHGCASYACAPAGFAPSGTPFGTGGARSEREGCEGRFAGAHEDAFGGGPFGVRRPLRFLANKLELSEAQIGELARIIEELKTERAQAEVDQRRTVTAFADAIEAATFGEPRAREGGDLRVKSAERLREAVLRALARMHAVLDDEQRKRLAYLIRTGVVSI